MRSRGKDTKLAKEQARDDHTEQDRGTEEKELTEWTSDKKDDGGKKGGKIGSKVNKLDWYGDKDKGSSGNKRQRERERQGKRHQWTNSIDEEDDQSSSWQSDLEEEKPEDLASLETPDDEGEWCWPKQNRISRWGKREDQRPTFHNLAEMEKSRCPNRCTIWSIEKQEEPGGHGSTSPPWPTPEQRRT